MGEATPGASEGEALGQEVKQLRQGGFLLLCIPSPSFLSSFLIHFLLSILCRPLINIHPLFFPVFPSSDTHFPQFLLGFPSRLG